MGIIFRYGDNPGNVGIVDVCINVCGSENELFSDFYYRACRLDTIYCERLLLPRNYWYWNIFRGQWYPKYLEAAVSELISVKIYSLNALWAGTYAENGLFYYDPDYDPYAHLIEQIDLIGLLNEAILQLPDFKKQWS